MNVSTSTEGQEGQDPEGWELRHLTLQLPASRSFPFPPTRVNLTFFCWQDVAFCQVLLIWCLNVC